MTKMNRIAGEPIVWILQETWSSRADLSSAQRYGRLETILSTSDKPSVAPGPCLFKIRAALENYREGDYLCYALADPAAALLVGIVLAQLRLTNAPINWLRWERERDRDGQRLDGAGFYAPSLINA